MTWDATPFRTRVQRALDDFLDTQAGRLEPLGPDAARLLTEAGDLCSFWFACDGRGHQYGVTEVLFVDRQATPL